MTIKFRKVKAAYIYFKDTLELVKTLVENTISYHLFALF